MAALGWLLNLGFAGSEAGAATSLLLLEEDMPHYFVVEKGATDVSFDIRILNSADGTAKTGMAWNDAGLTWYYRRGGTGTFTSITLATQTVTGAHSDGGFVEIDGTNGDGMYRIDPTDAVFATGVDRISMCLQGVSGMQPVWIFVELVNAVNVTSGVVQSNVTQISDDATAATNMEAFFDGTGYAGTGNTIPTVTTVTNDVGVNEWNGVSLATTNPLPNAAAGAAGGLPTDSTGKTSFNDPTAAANADAVWDELQSAHVTVGSFGELATEIASILDDTGTSGVIVTTNNDKTGYSLTATTGLGNQTADITGNLSGSVGSVTGHTPQTGDTYALANGANGFAAIKGDTAAILTDTASMGITKNAALSDFEFLMVDATDFATPETGLTVTGQRSLDGGAFAAVSGTIAEVGSGIYQFDALAADTNGDVVTWKFSATGAADRFVTFKTRA